MPPTVLPGRPGSTGELAIRLMTVRPLHPILPASMKSSRRSRDCYRIAVTGGPGGGKTTAADLFRREIGERVVIVPEAATILFQGGFPRSREPHALRSAQTCIFHVQRKLEDVQAALFPGRTLLCDRGTVDGAAYWPGETHHYFKAVDTTLEKELNRYDAVIFFETAAVGGSSIEGGNPIRNESLAEAVELDRRLRALWSQHPRFVFVPNNPSFFKKISFGLAALESIVAQLDRQPTPATRTPRKRKP
jgi:predicted ATPase